MGSHGVPLLSGLERQRRSKTIRAGFDDHMEHQLDSLAAKLGIPDWKIWSEKERYRVAAAAPPEQARFWRAACAWFEPLSCGSLREMHAHGALVAAGGDPWIESESEVTDFRCASA